MSNPNQEIPRMELEKPPITKDEFRKMLDRAYRENMKKSATIAVVSFFDEIAEYRQKGMTFEMIAGVFAEMGIPIKAATLNNLFYRERKKRPEAPKTVAHSSGLWEGQEGLPAETPAPVAAVDAKTQVTTTPVLAKTQVVVAETQVVPTTVAPVPMETVPVEVKAAVEPKTAVVPAAPVAKPAEPAKPTFEVDFLNDIYPPEILGKSGKPVMALPREYIKPHNKFKLKPPTPEEYEDYVFEQTIRPLVTRLLKDIPKDEKEFEPIKALRTWTDKNGKTWDVMDGFGPRGNPDIEREHAARQVQYLTARRKFLEECGVAVFHGAESDPAPRHSIRADLRPPLKVDVERLVQEHLED
jgi:hypothetical protein